MFAYFALATRERPQEIQRFIKHALQEYMGLI